MVSKNNKIKRMEEAAERQSHFGIRKLTIGAASVLLGTTLWLGTSAQSAQAATTDDNNQGGESTDSNKNVQPVTSETKVEVEKAATTLATQSNTAATATVSDNTTTEKAAESTDTSEKTETQNETATTVTSDNKVADKTQNIVATDNSNKVAAESKTVTSTATTEKQATNDQETKPATAAVKDQTIETQLLKVKNAELSTDQLSALLGVSLVSTNATDSDAVNIDNYQANFNITENPAYQQYFSNIPANEYAFQAYEVKNSTQKIVVTTDRNNIGENIKFYNVRNGQATLVYQMTKTTQTNASGRVVRNTPSSQGTFTTNGVTNNSEYQGGTYNWSLNQTSTANFAGIGNLKIGRIDITDGNGKSPVDNGTGAFVTDDAKRITVTWDQGLPISNSTIPGQTWNSAGSNVPNKVTQNIWYVDAETGDVLSHKVSDDALNGSSYNSTENALETITHDGKTYKLVNRDSSGLYNASDFSSNALNKELTTNNGVPITVGDILSTPLQGTLGDGRIGNVRGSITNYQGMRAFMRLQTKTDGTIDLNTYTFSPADSKGNLNTGLSKHNVAPGETVEGMGDSDQGGGAFYNGTRPGNRDIIFLYKAATPVANTQYANITFVNDDNGTTLSPQQNASGDAGSQIGFENAASTVANLINQGYVYNGTTGTGVTNGSANGNFTSVGFPVYDNDDNTNQAFVVHFKNAPQTTSYKQGNEESKTINRTINYYDKVTGEKIPSSLISKNPNADSVTFTRTQVLDQNGNVVGYGTVSQDGKSFRTQNWHTADGETTTQFNAKRSNDLSAYNYTAPEFQDGSNASIVAAHDVTPDTQDLVYNVYYGHQTQQVTTNEDVTRRFHYIFTDGTTPESHLTPQADQKVTFTGTATKDLVTGKTGDTVWTPSTGTLAQVAGQQVAGYHITGNINANADGSANAVTVNPTSGDIDVTIVYTPDAKKPETAQKAHVTIYDKTDNNKVLASFDNNNGKAGDTINFAGEPQTLNVYLNGGYVFDSATDANGNSIGTASNINFGNFDNIDDNVQNFNIYLVHGTDTKTETATTNAHVHYVVAGNDANKPAAPADSPTQTINWTRTNTTDKVTGTTTEGTWTPDKNSFTSVTSPEVSGYTPDQSVANFTTPQPNRDQVVTVVYNKNPEVAQKADLVIYDKTDNNKQLNNFDNSGNTGTPISFSGAAGYVSDLISRGYKIDSFVNDQNQTSNPASYGQINFDNYDNNAATDQHFKLYLVHDTENVTDKKTTTSTVHYVVSDGKTNPPTDNNQTINWTRPATKDKVTGTETPTGNWTTTENYNNVPTPNLDGYTPDKTNVPAPTPNPDQNPTTVVTYNPKTPEAPTYTGTTETKDVTRTINYYDRTTGEKIPANLISGNPTTQTVTLSRTHVVSSTGQDMGYGSVSADGKTFTKATTADGWNTGDWAQVTSPDLSNAGYTAPDLAQADQVTVTSATKDAVVNVYYGHQTEVITPNTPHNPGENINPNDPRNNPSVYPDGLTKSDLQQTVSRQINYVGVNEDGTTTAVKGSPDGTSTYTQTVTFNRNAVIDKVTGKILGYSTDGTTNVSTTDKDRAWTPTTQNMTSVVSKDPKSVGFDKVDISTVGGVTVYPGQALQNVTVTYTKDKTPEVTQKATLEIIDNNDANAPKQLASFGNEGKSEDQITFDNSDQVLQSYLNQGYVVQKTEGNLSGNAQTGYTYPTYGNSAQDFKIYLVHATEDKTETATATAQVHYVVADNGVQAPADSTLQTITYTRTNTVDKVTGQVTKEGEWKADKNSFTDVTSPDLSKDGYTPSVQTVQFNAPERNQNQRVTVVYNRSAQAADLQIIDDNDPANQRVLAVYSNGGASGTQISFNGSNEALQNYLKNGYTFEKSEGTGMSGNAQNGFTYPVFDNDGSTNQSFKIYLKHATEDKTETATTTAHVHYIMADGSQAPADSPTQTISWTRTNTVDKVTGQVTKEGTWTSDKSEFTDVKSPTVDGYTPGTENVQFKTPERGINQVVNVIYTKNAPTPEQQKALVVYQDVNDPAHPVDLGQSDQLTGQAGDTINYSTADQIANFEKQGYVLVSNGFDANGTKQVFDNVKDNTQTFYVTFKHGIQPVNPSTPGTPDQPIVPDNPTGPKYPNGTDKTSLTKEVTRTVTYEGAGDKTPSPVTDTLQFQGSGYLDKITGQWTDANGNVLADQSKGITWTIVDGTKDEGSFNLVPTKHIDGYTSKVVTEGADDGNGNVKSYTGINHTSNNINVVVQYSPVVAEQGNLIVKFHDDTDNKDLDGVGTDTGTQDVGTQVIYNPSTDLTNLENKGYIYVSTDGNIPSTIAKGTTTVTIHVKHGLQPVNPSNPGKPGDKINPNDPDPNAPKYPENTGKDSITKTITRTVHYEGADQYTPNDVQQSVNFTASGVLDKVTGEWTTPLTWSEDQTVNAVNSPKIPGYHVVSVDKDTTDNKNVNSATIGHTGSDYTVTVKYAKDAAPTPDTTTGKVSYIDDTTGQTLKNDSLSGNVGANIDYTTQDKIKNYINMGYKLVSNNFTDGKEVFNKDAASNNFEVHLVHDTVPVTPSNPGKPGDKINPNDPRPENEQPKYPAGTSENDLTKNITRTVHYSGADEYTPNDVKQTVTFTAKGVLDKVTGEWTTPLTWSEDQTFNSVKTPAIPGYHVVSVDKDADGTNVASTTIAHTGSDYTVNVVYAKDAVKQAENANLHIVDISDNNKELANFNASGDDNTAINFNGAQTTVDALIKAGYKVNSIVQATTDPNAPTKYGTDYASAASQWTFDDKPGLDQLFYVYVEHDYVPINPENAFGRTDLTQTVKETVHYVDEETGKPVATDYINTLTFKGQGRVDKVTGKMVKIKSIENGQITYDYNVDNEIDISSAKLSDFAWSNLTTLTKVVSPTIAGYTIDAAKTTPSDLADGNDIKEIANVGYDHADVEATVYYKANPAENHKAGLTIYANGKQVGTASVTGAKDTAINFGSASDIVAAYINNGYKFDHAQDLTNNKEMTGKSYSELDFGNFASENNSDQQFAIYLTKDETPAKTQQNAQLIIRDVTPGQEMDLGNYTQPGLEGDAISFNGAQSYIQDLINRGYVWDSASYNGSSLSATDYAGINFGNYDNTSDANGISQQWVINLVHGVTPVDPQHPDDKDGYTKDYLDRTITRDVTYVYEDGSQAAAPVHQEAHYQGAGYLDKVTGKWVTVENGKITGLAQGLTWTPDQDSTFEAIDAKTIDGYHVSSINGTSSSYTVGQDGAVGAQTVNKDTASSSVRVVYAKTPVTPVPATGSITYIDDTTGNILGNASFGGSVGDKINYTTADKIAHYEGLGYKLVSNDFNDGNETFKNGENKFEVHLAHTVTPITPENPSHGYDRKDLERTVTTTVHYVDESGKAMADDVQHSATFTATGYVDNVTGGLVTVDKDGNITGKATGLTWTPDKDFDAIPAKSFDGYTIKRVGGSSDRNVTVNYNTGEVGKQTMTPTTANTDITVVYAKTPVTPVPATGSITYIDDTTGNILGNASFGGSVGDKINYTTADKIAHYEGLGYKLVSNDFNDGNETFKNGENKFEVHLAHETETKDVTKNVTRDVTYVYEDGSQAESPVHQEYTFNGKTVTDKVTGSEKTTWNEDNHNFDATKSIDTTKYQIVEISKSNTTANVDRTTGIVASETVNPTSQNSTVVITLAKKEAPTPADQTVVGKQVVHYVDAEGNKLRDDNTNDTFVFTKSGKTGQWNVTSHKYADANAVLINGYVAEQKTYEGKTVTPESPNGEITIVYHKIGKIVPVDPSGKPIPDAPTPSYYNDPTDPTKVTPNQPTPTIPGWTTNVPKVTPEVPTKDTEVPYNKVTPTPDQGSIEVIVHDSTSNKDLPEYGKNSGKQNVGTDFSYNTTTTIKELEDKGYKVINKDVDVPTKVSKGDQKIVIYVEHNIIPVTPENPGNGLSQNDLQKTVTETVHYEGAGTSTPNDKTAKLNFTGTAYYDAVTKKWTDAQGNELKDQTKNITWIAQDGNKFSVVVTPAVDGYTPSVQNGYDDGNKNVKEITGITPDSKDVTVTVKYNKNEVPTPTPDQGSIEVVVHDNTSNKDLPEYGKNSGKQNVGTDFSYDKNTIIQTLQDKGYKVVNPDVVIPSKIAKGDQKIVIYVEHATSPVTPVDPHTPDTPSPKPQPETPVTPTPNVPDTPAPEVPDTPNVPDVPAPHGEDVPTNPDTPEVPDTPAPHGEEVPATPAPKVKETAKDTSAPAPHAAELPQTGSDDTIAAAIAGGALALVGLAGLAGAAKKRRRG